MLVSRRYRHEHYFAMPAPYLSSAAIVCRYMMPATLSMFIRAAIRCRARHALYLLVIMLTHIIVCRHYISPAAMSTPLDGDDAAICLMMRAV